MIGGQFLGDSGELQVKSKILFGQDGDKKLTRFPQAHSTNVVLCSLCPPRGWSGGGGGGGNKNVEGDLLTFG